jgi:hypothetical protein
MPSSGGAKPSSFSRDQAIDTDLQASLDVNIASCKRVCLVLGPYRNLTTLTASTLFLHPNCQVLNHARDRVYRIPEVDFLTAYSIEAFERFIKYAIYISGKGKRGRYGGSIAYSHAFDAQYEMACIFADKELGLIKGRVDCLLWKESLEASNFIRDNNVNIDELLSLEPRLVFLLPIRNPLDCALSNLRSGHANRFRGIGEDPSIRQCLKAVLREIHWFLSLQQKHKDRFFHYYAHSVSRDMLVELACFLSLSPDEDWLRSALRVMAIGGKYSHDFDLMIDYRNIVKAIFSDMPTAAKQLLEYNRIATGQGSQR